MALDAIESSLSSAITLLALSLWAVVNFPHLLGVGMSREGYGQQVDKEA